LRSAPFASAQRICSSKRNFFESAEVVCQAASINGSGGSHPEPTRRRSGNISHSSFQSVGCGQTRRISRQNAIRLSTVPVIVPDHRLDRRSYGGTCGAGNHSNLHADFSGKRRTLVPALSCSSVSTMRFAVMETASSSTRRTLSTVIHSVTSSPNFKRRSGSTTHDPIDPPWYERRRSHRSRARRTTLGEAFRPVAQTEPPGPPYRPPALRVSAESCCSLSRSAANASVKLTIAASDYQRSRRRPSSNQLFHSAGVRRAKRFHSKQ